MVIGVDPLGARAYVGRDWGRASAQKALYWAERKRRLGPAEGLRVAEELRRVVLAERPGWPGSRERAEDLAHHVWFSALLANASSARRR